MTYAVTAHRIFTGEQWLDNHAIMIGGETIEEVIPVSLLSHDISVLSYKNAMIVPGFVDLQVNGCGGKMLNEDISIATLDVMRKTMIKHGTTSFLPTLISASDEAIENAIDIVKTAKKMEASILGLHIEGPYLNKKKKGIHDESMIRKPDPKMILQLKENGNQTIKIMTVAPEIVSPSDIASLKESGIVVSAGHSMATYEEALSGFHAGITMVTHLFNAMPPLSGRSPGLLGATLDDPHVAASIIPDGVHVNWPNVRIAKRLKGHHLCLVTDAVTPAGTAMDTFSIGGEKMYHRDGRCYSEKGVLGGSALTLDNAVKNCVHHAGFSLEEALKMASTYPARVIGMDHVIGRIKKGFRADMAIMDRRLSIIATIGKGHLFDDFSAEEKKNCPTGPGIP